VKTLQFLVFNSHLAQVFRFFAHGTGNAITKLQQCKSFALHLGLAILARSA
jgi:hypothetical protein